VGRHRQDQLKVAEPEQAPPNMDYFEARAWEMEVKQKLRYAVDPPKDDDLSRHMRELEVSDLIQNYRFISDTYQKRSRSNA
jgi:hypothetical protein